MSDYTIKSPRKLIEVALPLDVINIACAREKSIRHGHPSSLHLWWARRPLAAARAVIFAQLVNDPGYQQGGGFKYGKNKKEAAIERKRLFKIIEDLVLWENTTDEEVVERARAEIRRSWREVCELNKDHPQAAELFNPNKLPALHDPFAGGGAIPLEAQRLGLEAYASDLNPVAVLINKAMIEIPSRFAGRPPVHPSDDSQLLTINDQRDWPGATGLAEDVRYYGDWMREEAQKRIGHLYPPVEITADMAKERPDLKPLIGQKLTVIAWLWARTVKSPNPAFSHVDVPLVGSFSVATKNGENVWVEPSINSGGGSNYTFVMRMGGKPRNEGTITSTGAKCVISGAPMTFAYIRAEAKANRLGARLMGIVAKHGSEKVYLSPCAVHEQLIDNLHRSEGPPGDIPVQALGIRVQLYGITQYADLFNKRQLLMLNTMTALIREFTVTNSPNVSAKDGYADAIKTYLALSMGRYADYGSSMTFWDQRGPSIQKTFGLPTLQMRWSYPEANPFADFSGGYEKLLSGVADSLANLPAGAGQADQVDAVSEGCRIAAVVSTDPPYYDNIGYASLSDYFYIWLRQALRDVYPALFTTILTPKEPELIAEPGRHQSKEAAAKYFEDGFSAFSNKLAIRSHPAFPCTIYYAFKQAEVERDGGDTVSTGWAVFLGGIINQGWEIIGTWPLRTEQKGGLRTAGRNSLASSIVLVCRKRPSDAPSISRREFIRELNGVLPEALDEMTKGSGDERSPVAPVDLSQAIIGPGMAVFSKYAAVLEADGSPMSVHTALQLINRFLAEDDFDADTQFCLHWFEQHGWAEGTFGDADTLSRGKGTSVDGMKEAGVLQSGGGKVRLFRWAEYPTDWDPRMDIRTPVWEALHQLIRALKQGGESASGALLAAIGGKAEAVRQLAYRLYTLCERLGQAEDARAYNELITSWTGIESAAASAPKPTDGMLPGFEK